MRGRWGSCSFQAVWGLVEVACEGKALFERGFCVNDEGAMIPKCFYVFGGY